MPPRSTPVRARRYRLGSLPRLSLVAVLGGARSPAQVARFAADLAPEGHDQLGLNRPSPAPSAGHFQTPAAWSGPQPPSRVREHGCNGSRHGEHRTPLLRRPREGVMGGQPD